MKVLKTAASIFMLSSVSAFAADLPSIKSAPAAAPVALWTGFYAGLNAGGTFGGNNQVSTNGIYAGTQNPGDDTNYTGLMSAFGASRNIGAGTGGFIGGGQVGYNYQLMQSYMIGVEADIQGIAGASANGQSAAVVPLLGSYDNGPTNVVTVYQPGEFFGTIVNASKTTSYLGTLRARIGFLPTQKLLVYATGGLSYGGVSTHVSLLQSNNDLSTTSQDYALYSPTWGKGSYSNDLVGWTAGGGAEWMFAQNWSVKGEYLYYDLGAVQYSATPLVTIAGYYPGIFSMVIPKASTRFNGNIIRAGLNYHFNFGSTPVVAKF